MVYAAVIVAGGSGSRMKSAVPKQFLPLCGKPVIIHTLELFLKYREELRIVLVLPESEISTGKALIEEHLSKKDSERIQCCTGGARRTNSVNEGLKHLGRWLGNTEDCWVAIHDGVRPFATWSMLDDAFEKVGEKGAAVACVPVKSSLREKTESGASQPVDRSRFYHVQTPQTFRLDLILQAYNGRPHDEFTDDASLYEAVKGPVQISEGSYSNIKLTTPEDMLVAEGIIALRSNASHLYQDP